MTRLRVAIVGAGIGGLTAAVVLAGHGCDVTVVERGPEPGGKLRRASIDGHAVDVGPTILTMRWVFDELLAAVGTSLDEHLTLEPADVLARHAWASGGRFDLFSSVERTAEGIAELAGLAEAQRYREFCGQAQRTYEVLERTFICSSRPSALELAARVGRSGIGGLLQIKPYSTLWSALGRYFHDPRLRQLFGRYATYCGSSPFRAPATLMLISHVERQGVWLVAEGMHGLARTLEAVARSQGAAFIYGRTATQVVLAHGRAAGINFSNNERIEADAVVINADPAAVSTGILGSQIASSVPHVRRADRSLSALTIAMVAETRGFPLVRHSVFFDGDSWREFDRLFRQASLPDRPTVYVCAQDRGAVDGPAPTGPERLLLIVNAPADGDKINLAEKEIDTCRARIADTLEKCGLTIVERRHATQMTTPADFERIFPGTGGALYGRVTHGSMGAFRRSGSRTGIPGMYLAGGSVHPGAGVPMAAISGRLAAMRLIEDLTSTQPYLPVAMPGGMSMR